MSAAARHHGGALYAAIARHGGTRAEWLDLSTGINPAPPPLPPIPPEAFARLPEREAEDALLAAARAFHGAPAAADIAAAPGSQALISALPHLMRPGVAAVLEPTYGEHRATLEAAGHRAVGIASFDDLPAEASLVVVVNPNNPDGRIVPRERLLTLADHLAETGGWLVVDEAFADAEPASSVAPETGRPGLLVHRSFGKFFGLAGLRLGFALTTADMAARLAERLGPWAVSGPALHVGTALMGDAGLVKRLRADILGQSRILAETLDASGLTTAGRTALFALVRHEGAGALFEALCRRRILTRPFAYRGDWLRIGNVADEAEAARLGLALRDALAEMPGASPSC